MRSFKDYYNEREQGSVNEAGFFQNMFGKKAVSGGSVAAGGPSPAGQDMFPMPQMPAKWNAEVDADRDDFISKRLIVAYLDAQKSGDQAKMKELEQQIAKSGYTDRLQHQLKRCKQLFSKHNFVSRHNGDQYAPFDCAAVDKLR